MEERVSVRVRGLQGGEAYPAESTGLCRRVADAWHILYEEPTEGCEAPVKVHVVVREKCVEIHRRGPVRADFLLEEGKNAETVYETDLLSFPLELKTRRLQICEKKDRITVKAAYELRSGGARVQDHSVEMCFESMASGAAEQGK